jgi:hypothetical protein
MQSNLSGGRNPEHFSRHGRPPRKKRIVPDRGEDESLCDLCRLVRQVKQFAGSNGGAPGRIVSSPHPCRLVRQVKQFAS